MPEDLRITVNELKKRMEAGEDLTVLDVRNPHTWQNRTGCCWKRSGCRWKSSKKTSAESRKIGVFAAPAKLKVEKQ